jgi:iron complex outermembrane receptor protein
VGLLEQRMDKGSSTRFLANVQVDYKMHFLPDLRAVVNIGVDDVAGDGTIVVDDSAATAYRVESSVTPGQFGYGENNQYKQSGLNTTTDFYLVYAKNLNKLNSRIDASAGTSYQAFKTQNDYFDSYSKNNILMGKTVFPNDVQENRLFSYFGRLGWTLANKYLLNVNARRDYSSRFSDNKKYGDFYGVSFAWKVKEESFLKNIDAINDLKVRVGYGAIGNQEGLGNYDHLSFYGLSNLTAQYQFGSSFYQGYRPGAYDGNRGWESTASTNLGVDFAFAKNRISGSVDVYRKKTSDLLSPKAQSAGSNFANIITANVGDMTNEGVELVLNTVPVKKKDFSVELAFNATYNKNTITKLTEVEDPNFIGFEIGGISGGTGNTIQIHSVGFPRASFYVYQQVYDANTKKPIENVFVDRNGDGVVNDKDRYRYNNPDPSWFFGFSPNVSFKKWNMGMVFRANVGNYVYNNYASATGVQRNVLNPLNFLANGSRNLLESGFTGSGSRYFLSDYYMENASFLRMDNLSLGYNAGRLIKGFNAGFRFNAAVQNVFVTSKYSGLDPEVFGGIDNNIYPRPRIFTLGAVVDLNLK